MKTAQYHEHGQAGPVEVTEWESTDRAYFVAQLGDVIELNGSLLVCCRSHVSASTWRPLVRGTRKITFREKGTLEEKTKEIKAAPSLDRYTQRLPRTMLVARMGPENFSQFQSAEEQGTLSDWIKQQNNSPEGEKLVMAIKSKLAARGGLAADAAAMKKNKSAVKKEGEHSRGALGQVFGHSIVAVIRTLGKAGLVFNQVQTALEGLKKTPEGKDLKLPAEATIKIQIGRGKRGEADPAPLTKEQLDTLKNLAGPAEVEKSKAKKEGKKPAAKAKKTEKKVKSTKGAEPAAEPTPPATAETGN